MFLMVLVVISTTAVRQALADDSNGINHTIAPTTDPAAGSDAADNQTLSSEADHGLPDGHLAAPPGNPLAAPQPDKWWEERRQDVLNCTVTYAAYVRTIHLKEHSTAAACARSCR